MEIGLKVMVMAVVQGLTEFLPVSSSGHLVLAKYFLKIESPGASLELFLHVGTLFSVLVYYRKKLLALAIGLFRQERTSLAYALWVLLSMIPAAVLYWGMEEVVESTYNSSLFVSAMLCVTGAILLALVSIRNREVRSGAFGWRDALLMGLAQAVALLPGISRSGSTICAARFAGVKPSEAAEFSFIMSIPVIAGATLVDALKGGPKVEGLSIGGCVAGAGVAFVVGLVAIGTLVKMLNGGRFWMFGIYCLAVGCASMLLILMT